MLFPSRFLICPWPNFTHVISLVMCEIVFNINWAIRVFSGGGADGRGGSEDVTVPKDIDLMALPQLCFPGIAQTRTPTHPHTERNTSPLRQVYGCCYEDKTYRLFSLDKTLWCTADPYTIRRVEAGQYLIIILIFWPETWKLVIVINVVFSWSHLH